MVCPIFRNAAIGFSIALLFTMCRKHTGSDPGTPEEPTEIKASDPVAMKVKVADVFGGYYVSLPRDYEAGKKNYPLLLFLHGAGQMGDGDADLPYLLNDGIGKILKDKKLPAEFSAGGKNYSFIIITPQSSREPTPAEVFNFFKYARETYRVDASRIYLSGLSLGSRVSTVVAAVRPGSFAALVSMAGVATYGDMAGRCDSIAKHNLPVWSFHNWDDPMSNVHDTEKFIDLLNSFSPAIAPKITIFQTYGHDAWTRALDPTYRENGMNIYEWMLQYSR